MRMAQPDSLVPPRFNGTILMGGSGGPSLHTNKCTYIDTNYDVISALICSMYILFGILYSFFGYRCFKTVMFLTGFIFGSVIVYLICLQENLMPQYGNAGVSLSAGLLFGLITMLVQYVGLFMMGLHTGLLLGLASLAAADHLMTAAAVPGSVWLCVGLLLAFGLLFAIVNLYWRKGLTILGTSVYGGGIMAVAVDYFVQRLHTVAWLWERVTLKPVEPPPCWYSWIVLAIWPAIVVVGLITQCVFTGRGIYHTDTIGGRKKPRVPIVQRAKTRAERAELRQKKYRYLYQVRTAHGDVISQNYVQALQKKETEMCGAPGECSTLQSDATHLTILPDTQLTALTESEEDDSQTEIPTQR